jgi:hypothetical protein
MDAMSPGPDALAQPHRAVHVGLRDRAARVRLERQLRQLPGLAETVEQLVEPSRVVAAGERGIEPVGALEHGLGSGEAGSGQQRGDHARVRAPAGVQSLGPRPVGEVLDDAGRLAAADAEGPRQLLLGQLVQPAGRRRGGKARRDGRRVEMAGVQRPGHGETHATHHLDGGDERLEDRGPTGADRLAHRQPGGDGHAAGVHDGVLAGVVEVEPVGERGVGQHGAGRRHAGAAAEQRALRNAAQALGDAQHRAAEILAGRGQSVAQRVERQQRRLGPHAGRHVVQGQADHEAGEAPGGGQGHGKDSTTRGRAPP